MAQVTIHREGKIIIKEIENGTFLKQAILQANNVIAMPCGGNGTCGKCKVKVLGKLSQPTEFEIEALGDEINNDIRLACYVKVLGDCEVFTENKKTHTLSWAQMPEIDISGDGYGIAVDIGTTTIATRLYDLSSGETLSEQLGANAQEIFGADVISRIDYAINGKAENLKDLIRNQLTDMAKECMEIANVSMLNKSVVTGNTTMLHFYEDLDATGIASAPFIPSSLFGRTSAFSLANSETYLPPCIGSYVGADIICAILGSQMTQNKGATTLLVDIGTNGEIALYKDGKIYCCSTAAGPAFEGAGIHMGMRAQEGAITDVDLNENGKVELKIIDDVKAVGICGSGIIDAVNVMLKLEIIDETGMMDEEYEGIGEIVEYNDQPAWKIPDTEVIITQKDIRQVQLAKSAICAGIYTLLLHTKTETSEIEEFFIAGGFGRYMNTQNAAEIGLFPKDILNKVDIIGNGALAGAAMLLLQPNFIEQANKIQAEALELSLSSSQEFTNFYVDCMMFGEDM